ncbi:TetR/AcrR family transcriptional regulator [Nocardioides sp. cx-173]|uniref:TetR/AcrR family transcriptional regulator n=1 Tax=Nocardioides sp. cx-173 TaxID=2898796 RepID=UPI001E50EA52|nr:TetR/AcrR family transcriptional regulator [Nocardioides sp. cx-173]MCD4525977.1 TetR family transcriptional regulator C-terminal domain-containing protein [Nocardioides sp. cx-173]UGB43674.1 TetR family transcriptional regulator C-terminal domain-containing protein [Nocardioides sp. cx-173]
MPKMVDRDQRRQELAHAVWRVIRRDGVEHASVRAVAREAGLSPGSLRHYFGSQSDLLVFAMRMVMERVESRVAALPRPEDPLPAAKLVLAELLPLDDERRAENEVWVAFTARALVDSELRVLRDEAYDRLREASDRWVMRLLPEAGPDLRWVETERLFALIDGLAIHAATRPEMVTPERLTAVLEAHLDRVGLEAAGLTPPHSPRGS